MSFTGDLEHLPIVDVIQLLHATRKTGTLCLKNRKGECQLVFSDGYIVGANHYNSSLRIGQVLVERQALSEERLQQVLQQQRESSPRRPLIALLIEGDHVSKEAAFKGLQYLIELTIVEVLGWDKGTFTLNVDQVVVSDEYRYFPETFGQELVLSAQNVLMDALRIYDERRRDGVEPEPDDTDFEFDLIDTPAPAPAAAAAAAAAETKGLEISEDLLGLAELDQVERKIPDVFIGIKDVDPSLQYRQMVRQYCGSLSTGDQEQLVALLKEAGAPKERGTVADGRGGGLALVLYGRESFCQYLVATLCKGLGYTTFATDDEGNLEPIIEQFLGKNLTPVLILDPPGDGPFAAERLAVLSRAKAERYANLLLLQLSGPEGSAVSLQQLGATPVRFLPCPDAVDLQGYVAAAHNFIDTLQSLLVALPGQMPRHELAALFETLDGVSSLKEPPEVAHALLKAVATICPRAVTLVVGKGELLGERGLGLAGPGRESQVKCRIPLDGAPLLGQVVANGTPYLGATGDAGVKDHLHAVIGTPRQDRILLLPLYSGGRVLAVIYGDFADGPCAVVPVAVLLTLARCAGMAVEIAALRKKFEKSAHSA